MGKNNNVHWFSYSGAPTISCQSNGQWSMTSPRCNPVDCGSPPHINLTTHQSDSTTFGSLAYYACLEGYEADRSLFIQCGWDTHWVGMSLIHCSPMLCDDAPVMEFGSATGKSSIMSIRIISFSEEHHRIGKNFIFQYHRFT